MVFLFAGLRIFYSAIALEKQMFALRLQITSAHNLETWTLVVVDGPCRQPTRGLFVDWLYNLEIDEDDLWLLIGDSNFYRSVDNRNKPGGNFNDIVVFNNIISHLGLIELLLKGRSYTWSNMQEVPLLEQVDWFFYLCCLDNPISFFCRATVGKNHL